jgi:predicted esterase
VTAPLFVTAGENDPRCPACQVDGCVERLRAHSHDVQYERVAAGRAIPTLDMKVTEMRHMLEFLARTLPADDLP